MNEMTEERAGELIRTKGKFNQASPPTRIYRSHSCLLGGKNISRVDIRSYRSEYLPFAAKITNRVQGATVGALYQV